MNEFIAQTSDPVYWSVLTIVLMKSVSIKIQLWLSKRDFGIVNDKIHKLENYSCQLISMSFELSQDQTVSFLKEARIGGYSIIGELIMDHNLWSIGARRRMFVTNMFVTNACSGQSVTSRLQSITS